MRWGRFGFELGYVGKKAAAQTRLCRSIVSSGQGPNLEETSRDDQKAARLWLSTFGSKTIPRNLCEISFSRSSGPGGQNVNKYLHYMYAQASSFLTFV